MSTEPTVQERETPEGRRLWLREAHQLPACWAAFGAGCLLLGLSLTIGRQALSGAIWAAVGVAALVYGMRGSRSCIVVGADRVVVRNAIRTREVRWSDVTVVETWPREPSGYMAPSVVIRRRDDDGVIIGAAKLDGWRWTSDERWHKADTFAGRLRELQPRPVGPSGDPG